MKDKVVVELIVPEIDERYNILLPINRKIGDVINLITKAVNEFSYGAYVGSNRTALYNSATSTRYEPNVLVYNTDIRNGTCLILL